MQISNQHYYSYGTAYTKSRAIAGSARSARNETPPISFTAYLDKVNNSNEARAKTTQGVYGGLSSVVSDLKAHNRTDNEGLHKGGNTDTWLPENKARLDAIYAEMSKLQAEEGNLNPANRSDESHKKWWDLISQRKVLEVYGESKAVTDEMMAVGAAAYREAEREWADANGWDVEKWAQEGTTEDLLKLLQNSRYSDQEELEKQLEEWKNSQIAGNGDSQTKKDFTKYMDRLLGRGKPGEAKSPEEKVKELAAKIKTLQIRLSEVVTDPSLPPAAKSAQTESLNSQINSLHAQIAELAKSIAEDPTSGTADA